MNEQERNRKRNRKLAEWVGIRYEPDQDVFRVIFPDGTWYNLGHDWKLDEIEPDFIQSLDACFKQLVPEARKRFGIIKIEFYYTADSVGCRLLSKYGALIELLAKTESDALCLAIEGLI